MARTLILTFVFIACAPALLAQIAAPIEDTIEFNDVIIVTSGGRIVGNIVEFNEGEEVVILRRDGEQFEVKWDKIAKITRLGEEDDTQLIILSSRAGPRDARRVRPHGAVHLVSCFSTGVHALGGKTLGDRFFVGLGTGWEMLSDADGGFVPLFVEATWFAVDGPAAPFLSVEAGHLIGWIEGDRSSDYDGNWTGFTFGVLGSFWDGTGLMFRMGLRQLDLGDHPLVDDSKSQAIVSLGVVF